MLDDQLLEEFIHTFYGYGNTRGRFWLIGMEEGGGHSIEVFQRRLDNWERTGKLGLEDLQGDVAAVDDSPWFGKRPKLQKTWSALIRVMLSVDGLFPSTAQVKSYQQMSLGRFSGENCLLNCYRCLRHR